MAVAVGTDEGQTSLLAALGEGVVLGEKAIARIDGVAFQRARNLDQRACVQIARFRRRRTDADGVIGSPAMARIGVGRTVDGNAFQAESTADADRPKGDFTAIGDQNPPHRLVPLLGGVEGQQGHLPTILPNLLLNVRLASFCFILQDFLFRFLIRLMQPLSIPIRFSKAVSNAVPMTAPRRRPLKARQKRFRP